jgi:molybdopterin molybdotransferase
MGRYDLVRDLMFDGGEVDFWKVLVKPGGPALFGRYRGTPLLGLPGNPVSSLVVFLVLGRAFVERALGSTLPPPYRRRTVARAGEEMTSSGAKETLLRVRLADAVDEAGAALGPVARTTGSQSSGILRSMAEADALAIVPPDTTIGVGRPVDLIRLEPLLR